jgi:hypothetical protein
MSDLSDAEIEEQHVVASIRRAIYRLSPDMRNLILERVTADPFDRLVQQHFNGVRTDRLERAGQELINQIKIQVELRVEALQDLIEFGTKEGQRLSNLSFVDAQRAMIAQPEMIMAGYTVRKSKRPGFWFVKCGRHAQDRLRHPEYEQAILSTLRGRRCITCRALPPKPALLQLERYNSWVSQYYPEVVPKKGTIPQKQLLEEQHQNMLQLIAQK